MARRKAKLNLPALRPSIPIDWDLVDKLLMAHCSGTEIAAHIGCHADTLYERLKLEKGTSFTDYALAKRAKGNSLLRTKQLQKALAGKGDNTMLIWLGKQYIGQTENPKAEEQFDGKLSKLLNFLMKANPEQLQDLTNTVDILPVKPDPEGINELE